jgi:Bacterial TSP3 repeat
LPDREAVGYRRRMKKLTFAILWVTAACRPDADHDGVNKRVEQELGLDPESADSDGDGVDDGAEIDAGMDPLSVDTDGDRLLDGDEAAAGGDPLLADTDGDGYLDGDEVTEGKDPADAASVIYEGGWPYYYAKDELEPGPGDTYEPGERFLRFRLVDQFGQRVDLYDFYDADRPVVLHLATASNPFSIKLDSYIRGEEDPQDYSQLWLAGPQVVERGDVYWITVLAEGAGGVPADPLAVVTYNERYGSQLPVLADDEYTVAGYAAVGFWPYVLVLDPELKVADVGASGATEDALAWLAERYPN